jgi:hypothetical protein
MDLAIAAILQVTLIAITIFAVIRDIQIYILERRGGFTASVTRGDPSMKVIFGGFAACVAAALWIFLAVDEYQRNRVTVAVITVSALIYLFFFSTWFRNSILFPLNNRIRRD